MGLPGRVKPMDRLARWWRAMRTVIVIVFVLIVALVELGHRQSHGHFFMPFTHHWDIETRVVPVGDAKQRQYRARLINWTLGSFPIERVRGERSLLWWGTAPSYRHRVERRPGPGGAWTITLREDLGEERSRRTVEDHKVDFGSSILTSWYAVSVPGVPDSLAGHPPLRDGDQIRFVILSRLNGPDDAPGQRLFVSPTVVVHGADSTASR